MSEGQTVSIDSCVYAQTFYGILNKDGQFWTPVPFPSKSAALGAIERFWGTQEAVDGFLVGARIVPVRIRLEAIAQTPGQPSAATNNKDQSE